VFGKRKIIGLAITFFAGLCFSLFSPAFNLATNDQWNRLKQGVPKLVVYTAFFYFSVSCFIIALLLNVGFLYYPVLGLPKSSFKAYLNDWNGRYWAFLAGFLCGFGNGLQFMGGQAAGYAAADSVQVHIFTFLSKYFGKIQESIFMVLSILCLIGSSTCEYILGSGFVWRIQKIVTENLSTSLLYVVYVHFSCCSSHGFFWT